MNTKSGDYQQQLLLALRLRNVAGPRIAEALAEVDSHVAETGEDAFQAFGDPKTYADRIASALGSTDRMGWRSILRSFTWRDGGIFLLAVAGPGLIFRGVGHLGSSGGGWLPGAEIVVGVALLAAVIAWMVLILRKEADPVVDPRTGRNMAPPFPKWVPVLMLVCVTGILLVSYFSGSAGR